MNEDVMKMEKTEERMLEVMPLVDITEDGDAVMMWFEIPGANSGTVSIEVKERILSITAESSLKRGGRRIRFRREFQLSDLIDVAGIKAKTQDGVLTLTLPKSDNARIHRIRVE